MQIRNDEAILKRPVANTAESIIEKANVRELVEFERFCRDNALWEEMHQCYAEDSQVNISWYRGTGHGFVEASSKLKSYAPHKIYNTEIWLHDDKAVAIMMTTIQMRHNIDGQPVELSSDAKLIFRVQKTGGRWYIVSFESVYEKDSIIPVFPNNNIHIPTDEITRYRKSYGCMIYLAKQSGMQVDENLPGIDRPDLVEQLYEATGEWLLKKQV